MAISDHNVLTKNYHGKVGNLILRVVRGRSIMSGISRLQQEEMESAAEAEQETIQACIDICQKGS